MFDVSWRLNVIEIWHLVNDIYPSIVQIVSASLRVKLYFCDTFPFSRVHLNDLENIPLFVLMGGLYVLTDPPQYCAIWHFRLFAISRILHTVAYRWQFPQPCRGLCFTVGAFTTLSMAMQIFMKLFPNVTFEVGVSDYASIHWSN